MRTVFPFAFAAAMAACSPAPAAPLPPVAGGELLVMNDGTARVREVRVRRAGLKQDWSFNLLGKEPIEAGEGRRLDISARGLGCEIEVKLFIEGRKEPVKGEQAVCDESRFWVGFALGLDEPGMGAGPNRSFAIRAEEGLDAPTQPLSPRPAAAPPIDLNRGLPICPGDPRCKKKK